MLSPNPQTRAQYQALFQDQANAKRIRKYYEALAPALSELEFPLIRHSRIARAAQFFRMQEIGGTPNSETTVDVLARHGTHWHYALQPLTGRTHQLRVHLAALGAGILGDRLYPELQPQAPDDHARPLQLLARALEFVDPRSGATRRFESERQLKNPSAIAAAGLPTPGPVQSIAPGEGQRGRNHRGPDSHRLS